MRAFVSRTSSVRPWPGRPCTFPASLSSTSRAASTTPRAISASSRRNGSASCCWPIAANIRTRSPATRSCRRWRIYWRRTAAYLQNRKPRLSRDFPRQNGTGWCSISGDDRSAELVVHADAHDVGLDIDRVGVDVARERKGRPKSGQVGAGRAGAAEIDIEIFGLERPAVADCVFGAGAGGPDDTRVADRSRFRRCRKRVGEVEIALHFGDRRTARGVEQPARRGEEADAAADGGEPIGRDLRRDGEGSRRAAGIDRRARRAALEAEIVDVAFEAEYGVVDLPVVAGGETTGHAGAVDALGADGGDGRDAAGREVAGRRKHGRCGRVGATPLP